MPAPQQQSEEPLNAEGKKVEVIAVDFDGTIAQYDGWQGHESLGEPIPEMVNKVKAELAKGNHVWIFTARVYPGDTHEEAMQSTESYLLIADYCKRVFGQLLPITFAKCKEIDRFLDDRATGIVMNTGLTHEEFLAKEAEGQLY